jgi:hypothetical protein
VVAKPNSVKIQAVLDDVLELLRWGLPVLALAFAVIWLLSTWNRLDSKPRPSGHGGSDLCPDCGYDVRGGLERCPECGSVTPYVRRQKLKALRAKLPADAIDPRRPEPHEEPVVVFTTERGMLAEILRQHLEARGIPAEVVKPQAVDRVLMLPPVSTRRLVVWSDDQDSAEAIVGALWQE